MINFISKIVDLCSDYYFVEHDRLLFEFENFLVIINFYLSDEVKDDLEEFIDNFNSGDFRENRLSDLPEEFKRGLSIDDIFISDYEYLGYRKDYDSSEPLTKSIALKLFSLLKVINSTAPHLVKSYKIDLNDGYQDSVDFCPSEPNYIFQIFIDHTSSEILELIGNLSQNVVTKVFPNLFYQPFFKAYKQLEYRKEVSIVNSNTKARRLGYLTLLSDFFQELPKVPLNKVNKRFEEYSVNLEESLLDYLNPKGIIKLTKTGISAQPYMTLASELQWTSKVHRVLVPGKSMKVYQVLKPQLDKKSKNPFYLSKLERLVFLEALLKNDFFYLSSILELLFASPDRCSYIYLRDNFQKHLIKRLDDNIQEIRFNTKSSKAIGNLKKIKDRIANWEKPEKYMEHVLMPRLNWLFDLKLVDFFRVNGSQLFKLTIYGEQLFKHLCFWMDINFGFITSSDEFLKRFYIHVFHAVYFDGNQTNNYSEEVIRHKVEEYLQESFNYFRTLAPNRVTASQAIAFTKYKLYCKDNIMVGQKFIENYLSEKSQTIFVYKFQEQYNDGYIQKIN